MPLFWFLAAALLLGALSILVWPLLRPPRAAAAVDADSAAIAVFRDQKRAIDAELDSGAITGAERDVVLGDLAQRMAEEIGGPTRPKDVVAAARPAWPLAIVLLLSIPALAIALYRQVGDPGAAATIAAVTGADGGAHELSEQQIVAMIDDLAHRLEQHPNDAQGWALLARSNYALGRFPAAADAFAKASALTQDNADLLADYADALAMVQGNHLAGKPVALIERALAIDPQHQKALALAATAAMEERDPDKAIAYWRRLGAQLPPGSDEARQVAAVIAQLGRAVPAAGSSTQMSARAGSATAAAGTIGGRVTLSASLAGKVSPTDTVFIFARATNGPRMPLAALRIPAAELPKDFELDDTMGMAGVKLSSASEVVVEARLSKSGNALPQTGDLFGRSAPTKPGTAGLHITIDQVVP
ncbi:MAG TPA: c-type cytochrome biogenesis protein CcmI [Casimicrobiaceae bacterium]